VATDNNQINFFGDEGALLPACVISRQCNVTCMAWQTKARILATGWADGHVGVYAVSSAGKLDCVYANDQAHGSGGGGGGGGSGPAQGVRFTLWNPAGTRLVTGDGEGLVRVWKADGRGLLSAFKMYAQRDKNTPLHLFPVETCT